MSIVLDSEVTTEYPLSVAFETRKYDSLFSMACTLFIQPQRMYRQTDLLGVTIQRTGNIMNTLASAIPAQKHDLRCRPATPFFFQLSHSGLHINRPWRKISQSTARNRQPSIFLGKAYAMLSLFITSTTPTVYDCPSTSGRQSPA